MDLPLHPLIVHAVVVLVPLTALALAFGSVIPPLRRRLGIATPILALVALIATPITIQSGQALMMQVGGDPSVFAHAALGRTLPPWAIGMFAVAAVQWGWFRFRRTADEPGVMDRVVPIVLAVLAITVAAGATTVVFLTGEAGARSVWG